MLKAHEHILIRQLHRRGYSIRAISRLINRARESVAKVLEAEPQQEGLSAVTRPQSKRRAGRRSSVEAFKAHVLASISPKGVCTNQLLAEIRQQGYSASKRALQRFLHAQSAKQVSCREQERDWMRLVLMGAIDEERARKELGTALAEKDTAFLLDYVRMKPLKLRNRALAILAHVKGISSREIAAFLCRSRVTIQNYIQVFRKAGVGRVLDLSRKEVKKAEDPTYADSVFKTLHTPPRLLGYNRTTWRMDDLQAALAQQGVRIAKVNIRKIIKKAGYRYRKARKVLTSTDPEYREKLQRVTQILAHLETDQKFFSIDEFGPFAIKIHGGCALTRPGEIRSVPQHQKSKGTLIVTAALELSTNQITHFYSAKKNTDEMIRLLDLLIRQYRDQRRIYFSWDAASWHASKKFVKRVKEINASAYRKQYGTPEVELAPLPASAQFLNVIESVFSGMAKAIIHNSDYQSVEECKTSIDRYFDERNDHFRKHPKKAGNKIWGKERVVSEFDPSKNCKDPRW